MTDSTVKGLGRGLDALIPGGDDTTGSQGPSEININLIDINPHQPRTVFDEEELKELSASIKKHGVLQPLVVTPAGDHYELIAGERRLRASKLAGLSKVPVIVRDVEEHEKLELAIIENIHRCNLNPIDEALSYRNLMEEFNYTQDQVAETVGKSRAGVANKLRVLTLSAEIKRALKEGKITEGHAKALLAVEDSKKRDLLFSKILSEGLNVRDVERAAKETKATVREPSGAQTETDLATKQLADDLSAHFGSKVSIKKIGERWQARD